VGRARGGRAPPGRGAALKRRGDGPVEANALLRAQPPAALDPAHGPPAQHRRKLLAHGAPAGRSGLTWGGLARGSLAGGGVGAGAIAAGGILSALAPILLRLAPGRGLTRSGRGRRRQGAVEARLLLVVERAVEGRERGLERVAGRGRGDGPLLPRLDPRRYARGGDLTS